MEPTTEVDDRIERARTQSMTATVVRDDPLVVEVENRDSDDGPSVHTLLPDELYCGCWDHRSRTTLCKHLIFLVMGEDESVPDDVAEATAVALDDRLDEVRAEIEDLSFRLHELRAEREAITTVRADGGHESGTDAGPMDLAVDAEELVQELYGSD